MPSDDQPKGPQKEVKPPQAQEPPQPRKPEEQGPQITGATPIEVASTRSVGVITTEDLRRRAETQGLTLVEMTFPALQELHVRPATTTFRIIREHNPRCKKTGGNPDDIDCKLFIPVGKDGEGNAPGSLGWQEMCRSDQLRDLGVQGPEAHNNQPRQIDMIAIGPDEQVVRQMTDMLTVAYHDNFQQRVKDYIKKREDNPEEYGKMLAQASGQSGGELRFQDTSFSEELVELGLIRRHREQGNVVLVGSGGESGMVVYGPVKRDPLQERGKVIDYGLVSEDKVPLQIRRLDALMDIITTGRKHATDAEIAALGLTDEKEFKAMRKGEADYLGQLRMPLATRLAQPVTQGIVDALGLPLTVGEETHPNLELAIRCQFMLDDQGKPKEMDDAQRANAEADMRTLLLPTRDGFSETHILAYVLRRAIKPKGQEPVFRQAGVYLLEPSSRELVSRYEWKKGGFQTVPGDARIPLDKPEDGTAVIARRAMESGRQEVMIVEDTFHNPDTRGGFCENPNCAWATIHAPTEEPGKVGELLGVIWADKEGERIDGNEVIMEGGLKETALRAGDLLQMRRQTQETLTRLHEGWVAILPRDPTPDQVIELRHMGFEGWGSLHGKSNCHGAIAAGAARQAIIMGVDPEQLDRIEDGTPVLIADPIDDRNSVMIESPGRRIGEFFGCELQGPERGYAIVLPQKVSIEPEVGEIRNMVTSDGFRIVGGATLNGFNESQLARATRYGAEGLYLFRTEIATSTDLQPLRVKLNSRLPAFTLGDNNYANIQQANNSFDRFDLINAGSHVESVEPLDEIGGARRWRVRTDLREELTLRHQGDELLVFAGNDDDESRIRGRFIAYANPDHPTHIEVFEPDSFRVLEEYLTRRYSRVDDYLYDHAPPEYRECPSLKRTFDITEDKYLPILQEAYGPDALRGGMTSLRFIAEPRRRRLLDANMGAIIRSAATARQQTGVILPNAQHISDVQACRESFDRIMRRLEQVGKSPDRQVLFILQYESRMGLSKMASLHPYYDIASYGSNDLGESFTETPRSAGEKTEYAPTLAEALLSSRRSCRRADKPYYTCGALSEEFEGIALQIGLEAILDDEAGVPPDRGSVTISLPPRRLLQRREEMGLLDSRECGGWAREIISHSESQNQETPQNIWDHKKAYEYLRQRIEEKREKSREGKQAN
ncbi:MAG: hypothetical protein GF416_02605 [Candidatus Altiarchaeales archaeon]|nr:hypothetical protein [Candidatus Altiarchaeales archaeon]MBD3416010.1 hypothetical protein [Candidatus Altiarchaeales archaeon]